MLATIVVVILFLLLLGAILTWPHSSSWGPGPSSLIGVVLVIVLVLLLVGRL